MYKYKPHLSKKSFAILGSSILMTIASNSLPVNAHGLVEFPASRQQTCGVLTKPDGALTPNALYPVCAEAFADHGSNGYNYMSVLTHSRGRLRPLPALKPNENAPGNEVNGATPVLPENVCGYNAETFGLSATPWDEAIDWPTSSINAGRNLFLWNIQWGPHFDDTQEFHYWITKENYTFELGKALTWDDFEEQPFCKLDFDAADYDANENIIADTDNAKFYTYCDVPERSGQHVIYSEWGRNHFTWERFHSCIDVEFNDTGSPTAQAVISMAPSGDLTGANTIELSGSRSIGENLTYHWSIKEGATDATYTFSDINAETTTLSFSDPSVSGQVSIYLTISSDDIESTQVLSLKHQPEAFISNWELQQALTKERALVSGDTIQMRVVLDSGLDVYIPAEPIELTTETATAARWPLTLATAVNEADSHIVIGVLDGNTDTVSAIESASANNIYSKLDAPIASVFLNIDSDVVVPGSDVNCYYEVSGEWHGGFNGKVVIENNSNEAISGWEVNWSYSDGSRITQAWNTNLSDTYTATNLSWNANIAPGAKVEFGFIGVSSSHIAQIPTVSGDVCESTGTIPTPVPVTPTPVPVTPTPVPVTPTPVPVTPTPVPVTPTPTLIPTPYPPVPIPVTPTPVPNPSAVLIFEDFEDKTTGEVPTGWGTNVNYSQSQPDSANALQHSNVFQVVDTVAHSGSKSVYVSGADQTKRYLFKDIAGLNEERMYVRLYIRSSEYIGNRSDTSMNHNHFLSVSDGDQHSEQEVRIGEMKGAIGINDSRSDDLYPKYEDWWGKTATARIDADTWYCVEASFDNTSEEYSQQKVWLDNKLILNVNSPADFNNNGIADKWLTDRFSRVNLGWASWNTYANNLYFDDIVVSTDRIGCL